MSLFGSIIGGVLGLVGGERRNSAQADESQANRDFQERMRATQWQTTVDDMQKAGINPMAAYQSGGAGTPAGSMGTMENSAQSAIQGAMAGAQVKQVEAQTELIEAQKAKTEAEIPAITTSTANVAQQTENLKAILPKIQAEIGDLLESKNLKFHQGLSEVEKRNLMDAQRKLANIEYELRAEQITNTQAITRTQEVITQLKRYEIAGAKNTSEFEEKMSGATKYGGAAGNAAKTLGTVLNSAKKVLGK